MYRYGFDEVRMTLPTTRLSMQASGNFQGAVLLATVMLICAEHNFSGKGKGGDAVVAMAQDGSGTNK